MFFLPEACLFDLDGLLIDTEKLHSQAWLQAASAFGVKLSNHQLLQLKGRRRIECAQAIVDLVVTSIGVDELLSVQQPIARRLLSQSNAIPGAENLVRWCSEHNLPMALVTSSSAESVAFKTAPHTWLELIKTRVFGDDFLLKAGKPAPDGFLLAAQRLRVNPKACWALEDSLAGTQAALAAGCQVWVLGESQKEIDPNPIPSLTNPMHISQLKTVTEKLNQGWLSLKRSQ